MRGLGHTILGISPGTQIMGIAVFEGKVLVDRGCKIFKGKYSDSKLEKIIKTIERYVEDYEVEALALKVNSERSTSTFMEEIISKVIDFAKDKGLPVYQYTIDEIKKCFSDCEINNKIELLEKTVERIPELLYEYKKELKKGEGYYIRMFEAVAVAIICADEI